MKRRDKNLEEFVLRHLGLHKTPPQPEMDLAESRIEDHLRTATPSAAEASVDFGIRSRGTKLKRVAFAFAAAAAIVLVAVLLQMPRNDLYAAVETADHSLSRVLGTRTEAVGVGEKVPAGDILRTTDGKGTIKLPDGTRVEMRDQSELSWEPTSDGMRILLTRGSVIIDATYGDRRLYVQTHDALVLGMGSVFLVSAEGEGSRIAVIQGEVQSKQGAADKSLLSGEQVTTNSQMKPYEIQEQVSWSRNADAHIALLQQIATVVPEKPVEARPAFEVISIRPSAPIQMTTRGGPAGIVPRLNPEVEQAMTRNQACGGPLALIEVTAGRFMATGVTVYRLLTLAYGLQDCTLAIQTSLIAGGPDWLKADRFDIQATIPEGSPSYTRQQLNAGEAPKLQLMIQNLLADRFKLTVRRETKDIQGFNLVIAKAGKIKLSEDQSAPEPYDGRGLISSNLPRGVMLNCVGNAVSISRVANCFEKNVGGPITDKTDLKGLYDIPQAANPDPSSPMSGAYRASQTFEQIGLKLEATKVPREVITIERVEKPSEN